MNKIGILGTGAYGIALAKMFYENNNQITMWTKFLNERDMLLETRCNDKLLPNVYLDSDILITSDLLEVTKCDILVICIPSMFVKETLKEIKSLVNKDIILCMASKGIDLETGKLLPELLMDYFDKEKITIISGPSFAKDLVTKEPTGLTIAGYSNTSIEIVKRSLANKYLKIVPTRDVIGVSICGALKNIMAIASGMLFGFNANPSCNVMFLTEVIHDIKDLIKELKGCNRTILSYAGIGDILLTCTSSDSRNFTFGYNLVTKSKEEVLEYRNNTTIEGLDNLLAIKKLLDKHDIKMPIIEIIDNIVNNNQNPKILLDYLMNK